MLLSERIQEENITVGFEMTGVSDDGMRMTYDVTLHREGRSFSLPDPFETDEEEVTAFEVLDLLLGACAIIHRARDREAWASEYTTDPEEREEHFPQEDFETWKRIDRGLADLLGGGDTSYEDWLYDTSHES